MANMDRKLVAFKQRYDVAYIAARKHPISAADAGAVLQQGGRSREQANQLAEASKQR